MRQRDLDKQIPIVESDGTPTDFFIRTLLERKKEVDGKLDESRRIDTTDGVQGGGDLSADRTLSLTDTGVVAGSYPRADVTVDVKGRITSISSGNDIDYGLAFFITSSPLTNETLCLHYMTENITIPANFSSSGGKVGTNATSTYVITVYKNPTFTAGAITGGTTIGTISISNTGVLTFATTGGLSQALVAGDWLGFKGQTTVDPTLADFAITIRGAR